VSSARLALNRATRSIGQSHFAQSSDIGSASICGRKFLLPRMLGAVSRGNEAYIPGSIAHTVLERVAPSWLDLWRNQANAEMILREWQVTTQITFDEFRTRAEANGHAGTETYINTAQDRLNRLASVLANYFTETQVPRRIVTEITLSNPITRHEGRVDAIFEYGRSAETVDWKTNDTGNVTEYERIQTVSNGMLVNYRYNRREDDFANNRMTIFTPEGIHHILPTPRAIQVVRDARRFILDSLANLHPRNDLPHPAVCAACSYYDPCRFYMYDRTPDNVRKLLWTRRFRVLKKRERSHLNKILSIELSPSELEELGILESGFTFVSVRQDSPPVLSLRRNANHSRFFSGDSVRVIGREPNVPLLASVSCNGSVSDVRDGQVSVRVFRGRPSTLEGFEVAILRTDVDLSKRELESIDRVHRNVGPYQDLALALIGENDD
jgi:hypothetical protein